MNGFDPGLSGLGVSRRKVGLVPEVQDLEIFWSKIGLDPEYPGERFGWFQKSKG